MIVDSHAHITLPIGNYMKAMEETGIDRAILFATSVHPEKADDAAGFEAEMNRLMSVVLAGATSLEARRTSMEELVGTIDQWPDRFLGFCSVPLGMTSDETGRWIEEYVVKKGCVGIGEIATPAGCIDSLSTIFGLARDFGNLPLWVHTFAPLQLTDIEALVQLAKVHPSVPLILGHVGGLNWLETIKLAKTASSVYLDLSATYTRFAARFAIMELPDRTIFSSDYPYGDPYATKIGLDRITPDSTVRELVLGGTMLSLLAGRC